MFGDSRDPDHPYGWRTRLRPKLPWFLRNLGIAAKGEDCERVEAEHSWYNLDGERSACYHCRVLRPGRWWSAGPGAGPDPRAGGGSESGPPDADPPTRHPQNAPGPFFVENDCCIACGAPEREAPDLMAHEDSEETGYHCYFRKQPSTPEQLDQAIRAVWVSCCGAVQYGGEDPDVLRRLSQLRERGARRAGVWRWWTRTAAVVGWAAAAAGLLWLLLRFAGE